MSKEYLPEKVNAFRFAELGTSLQGMLFIKDMPRLNSSLVDDKGEVIVSMTFGVDEQSIPIVKGNVTAEVTLQCQRCMEPFIYDIIDRFQFGIVATEQEAELLPKQYDPVLTEEGMLLVRDMIEDGLIVSLPIVAMHNEQECKVKLPLAAGKGEVGKDSPFKVIEVLQSKRSKSE